MVKEGGGWAGGWCPAEFCQTEKRIYDTYPFVVHQKECIKIDFLYCPSSLQWWCKFFRDIKLLVYPKGVFWAVDYLFPGFGERKER